MTDFKVEPMYANIIVRRDSADKKSAGGILLPEMSQVKKERGTVMAVGAGRYNGATGKLIPMITKVGDDVIFLQHSGTDILVDDQEYMVLEENSVICRVRKDSDANTNEKA